MTKQVKKTYNLRPRNKQLADAAIKVGAYALKKTLKSVHQRWMNKKRGTGSKTRQRRRRLARENDLLEISQHNDLSMHLLPSLYLPGKKHHCKKGTAVIRYQETCNTVTTSDFGRQLWGFCEHIYPRSKLIGGIATDRRDTNQMNSDIWLTNLHGERGNNTLFPGPHPEVEPASSIFLRDTNYTLEFLSLDSIPVVVDLYFFTPAFDTAIDPIAWWQLAISRLGYTATLPVQADDTADITARVAGRAFAEKWGEDPRSTKGFTRVWKVLMKKTFVLQPGDQRNYKGVIHHNTAIMRSTLIDGRTQPYLRGITVLPIFICRGGLQGVRNVVLNSAIEVAHAPAKVGCASTYDHTFGFPALPELSVKLQEENLLVGLIPAEQAASKFIDDTDELEIPFTN